MDDERDKELVVFFSLDAVILMIKVKRHTNDYFKDY